MGSRGFSLVESLVAIAFVGITMVIAYPRMRVAMAKSTVRSARTAVINQYARARAHAIHSGRDTRLRIAGNRAFVYDTPRVNPPLAGNAIDTVGPIQDLASEYGVTVTPDTVLRIDPRGLGQNGATVRVTKAGHTDSMVVSGFGRVQK
jgi:prepilin-type N-terminal cleavage/methylation domain-containing protein